MTAISPNVATNSLKNWAFPALIFVEAEKAGSSNIKFAMPTPKNAPKIWHKI